MATETDTTGEPQELRKAYDKLKSDFETLQGNHRNLLATTTFKEAKLNPKHAELFLKVNGDEPITSEAALKFAEDYGLQVAQEAEADTPAVTPKEPADKSLASMSGAGTPGGGTGNATLSGPKMSQKEFQTLYAKDKTAALQAYTEGRVEHAKGNVIADDAVEKGLLAG